MRLHRRNRFANLDRIVRLDPEVDADEILTLTSRHDFPWDYQQGTGIAFMRDYGIPSIAALLDRTGEFEHHGVKRYDDTLLVGDQATIDGIDSPRSHWSWNGTTSLSRKVPTASRNASCSWSKIARAMPSS